MRKHHFHFALVLIISIGIVTAVGCKKNKDDNEDCKTCKALNSNGSTAAEQQVCTGAAEESFRNSHPDKEIVCN